MGCNCGGGAAVHIFIVTFPGGDKVWCPDREMAGAAIIDAGGGTAQEIVGYAAEILKGQYQEWTPAPVAES